MLRGSRRIQPQTRVARRPQPKYARPTIGVFPEDEGAFSFTQRLVEEYVDIEDGHHAAVRQFLQRCYTVALKFQREPDEFEHLKADPFWEASRQRPKDPSTSKWVIYFVMGDDDERSQSRRQACGAPRRIDSRQSEARRGCGAHQGDGRGRGRL